MVVIAVVGRERSGVLCIAGAHKYFILSAGEANGFWHHSGHMITWYIMRLGRQLEAVNMRLVIVVVVVVCGLFGVGAWACFKNCNLQNSIENQKKFRVLVCVCVSYRKLRQVSSCESFQSIF